jgi:hypothetical protein
LFRPEVWRSLSIPKQRHIQDENEFYGNFLTERLSRAERFLCELWSYDFQDLKDKVTYLYGRGDQPNTASKYVLTRWKNVTKPKTIYESLTHEDADVIIEDLIDDYGDGTVLQEIADGSGFSNPLRAHMGSKSHQELLDDRVFQVLLAHFIKSSKLAIIMKASNDPTKAAAIVRFAFSNNVLFSIGDAFATNFNFDSITQEVAWIVQTNKHLLDERKVDQSFFEALAKASADKDIKAEAYAQIIANTSIPMTQRLWSANNLGHQVGSVKEGRARQRCHFVYERQEYRKFESKIGN